MDSCNEITKLPSVLALAYIGDSAHSLYVRHMLVKRGLTKPRDLNKEAEKYVTAEAQAKMYEAVEPYLFEEEKDVFKRAFNSTHLNKPKRASGKDYRTATGFEAVVGMLVWLGNKERLFELFDKIHKKDKENDTEN